MKPFYFFLLVFAFISCGKDEDCVDEVVGIYTGNCASNVGTFQGDMTISSSSTGASNVLIQDDMLDSGISTYNGTLSGDCNTITVPSQSVVFTNGFAATINGTFQINGSSLTGNLSVVSGSIGSICSYNLTKR